MTRFHLALLAAVLTACALQGCRQAQEQTLRGFASGPGTGTDTISMPLSPAANGACLIERGEYRLFDRIAAQKAAEPVVIEAESALHLHFQDDVFARRSGDGMLQIKRPASEYSPQSDDPQACGGKYVDYCSDGRYAFRIKTGGRYTFWARHWVPRQGSWGYFLRFDDQEEKRIVVSENGLREGIPPRPAGKWFWVRGGEFDLGPGTHEMRVKFLHNGKRLDRFILSRDPEFDPEKMELPPADEEIPGDGTVVFQPLAPAAFLGWNRVIADCPAVGTVSFEASANGGKTWHKLPKDLSLYSLRDFSEKQFPLIIRMTLARNGGQGPRIRTPSVSYHSDPSEWIVLRDNMTELFFSRRTGSLSGIRHRPSGRVISPLGFQQEMFELLLKEPGRPERRWLTFRDAKLASIGLKGEALAIEWTLPESIEVYMEIRMAGDGKADWDVTVTNGGGRLDVLEVVAPKVGGLRISDNAADDSMVWPFSSGEFIHFPASRGELSVAYLSHGGFPFIDLFNKDRGFYFAVHDPVLVATILSCQGAADQQSISFSAKRRNRIRPGTSRTYRFAIAIHEGDWHSGALIYRGYFHRHYPVNTYTRKLRDTDGWCTGGAAGARAVGKEKASYADIMGDYLRAAWLGTLHMQGWGSIGNGACPTFYLPRKELGGEELLASTIRKWRAAGGSTGYYFHGTRIAPYYTLSELYFKIPWSEYPPELLPPDWEWFERNLFYESEEWKPPRGQWLAKTRELNARRMAGEDLGQQAEEKNTGHFLMTWGNREMADYLTKWIDRYVRIYSCDTAYLDTFAFYNEDADYNPFDKIHGDTAVCMANRVEFLDRLFREMRRHEPEFVALCEGVADVFGSRLFYLLSGFAKDGNIMRYILPDQIYFQGQLNGLWTRELAWHSTATSFVCGNRLDILHPYPRIFHLMRLRQRIGPFLNHAVFEDTTGLRVPEGVTAFAHRIGPDTGALVPNDGSKVATITFLNENGISGPAEYRLPAGFDLKRAFLVEFCRDPAPLDCDIVDDGRGVRFPVSPAAASAVVLIDTVAGSERWTALTQPIDRETIGVDIFNFSEIVQNLRVSALYPPENPAWKRREEVRILPGRLARIILKDSAPGDEGKLVPVEVSDSDGIKKDLISLFGSVKELKTPPREFPIWAPQDETILDFEHQVERISGGAFRGGGCLLLEGKGGKSKETISIPLAPETEYRLTVQMRKETGARRALMSVFGLQDGVEKEKYGAVGSSVADDGQWHEATLSFRTGPGILQAMLCFDNDMSQKEDFARFDEIRIQRMPEAR